MICQQSPRSLTILKPGICILQVALILFFQLSPSVLQANPSGEQVVAGAASFDQSGSTLNVNQTTDKAIINWQQFSIGQGETTKFIQPSASSAVLNRVVGNNLSSIYGNLKANGQVYLINPNGIVVGATGVINTGGFVASTGNVADSEFLAGGDLKFQNANAKIQNLGKISVDGGDILLIAREVSNQGELKAINGKVGLAGASEVLVKASGEERLFIEPSSKSSTVSNAGLIEAASAEIKAAGGNEYALAINNSGTIRATGAVNEGGRILLKANTGKVRNSGSLVAKPAATADPSAAAFTKAEIKAFGDTVELATGTNIEAAGGFVETSGKDVIVADDVTVSTKAEDGSFGKWLIDPTNFTISAGSGAQTSSGIGATTLSTNLGSTSIQITTAASGVESGHIFVNAPVTWSAATTLTLTAHGDIYINAPITANNAAGKLALQYGQGAVAAGNLSDYYINAPVNLQAGLNFSTKLGSDGTTLDYRVITSLGAQGSSTGTDLQGMSNNVSGRYVLGANIDASATSGWNSGAGFQPIGSGSSEFNGTLDGLGHTIDGLFINRPTANVAGLFGFTGSGSRIRNVGLERSSVSGEDYVGGFIGFNSGGSITRSYASGTVTGSGDFIGGLVGYQQLGGSIAQSYSTSSVTGGNRVGGLVGRLFSGATISQSYATGLVTGSNAGGLVGSSSGSSVVQSYWDTQTTGQAGSAGGTGLTTAQMKTQSSFTGWDFAGTWRMVEGGTYPLLTALSKSISGTAYSDAGVTNVGSGVSIQFGANGISLGTATTTAGGAFQLFVQGTPTQGLAWIDNSVSVKGTTILSNLGTQNLDLWGGYVRAADGTSNSIASTAKGALSDTDILFTSSGNNLTLAANTKFLAIGAYTLNGDITAQGTGTLGFNGAVTLTANSALTTSNQNINFGSSIAGNYGLTLAAGTGNITTHVVNTTVNVGTFRLNSGNWSQNSATLPSFTATDFQFAGGTFLRVRGGNGTTATPYQITDIYGLQGIGSQLSNNFQLTNDINASGTVSWNTGAGFSPIGSGNGGGRFSGRFDGLGHTIDGLVINRTGLDDVALFGGSSGTIQNVGLVGGSMAGGNYAGSLVGRNYGTVTLSFSTANVTSNGGWVGGLVGAAYSGSIITQSYATGNVSGFAVIGGLVGLNSNAGPGSAALIQQSYATGSVSGSQSGGLVGQSFTGTTITQSYATGGRPLLGGGAGTVTNSYSVGNGITLAQLEAALPAGFDTTVWGNADNHSTPYIKAISLSRAYIDSDPGTARLYQIIQNVNELQSMSNNLAGRYALGNAIDASATSGWNSGLGFNPIGVDDTSGFTGTFDGLGHVLSGLTINRPSQDYVGLFGFIDTGSEVKNVGLSGGSVLGKFYVGGLAGWNVGNVSGSYVTGTVSGRVGVGGLAGVNTGNVSGSYATAAVSSPFSGIGGLVGVNFATVSTSYATGTVSGDSRIGGLVGQNSGTVSNSYATGAVSGTTDRIGGLVGLLDGTVDMSYATGAVSGPSGSGGLVGDSDFDSVVTNSYWATDSSGRSTSDGGIGKTTTEMKQLATFSGWDISSTGGTANVWRIYEGYTTPLLRSFLKAVTATVDTGGSKVYDGTTAATGVSYSLSNPSAAGDIMGTPTYTLNSRNAGSRSATLAGLYSGQQGYDITIQSAAYTVGQRAVSLSTSNINRGYDGTTNAAGTAVVTLGTLGTGDSLGTGSFSFDNKNVGTGKTVIVNSVTLNDGNGGNNYLVTLVNNTSSSISAANLTVTAEADSRGYNGTTGSTVGPVVSGTLYDSIGTNATQAFDDKNVGTGKTLTASGLVVNDGNSGNNYSITYVGNTTGIITAAAVTVTAQTDTRGYNGTSSSAVGPAVNGTLYDAIGTNAAQSFDNKNVGTGKTLTASGLVLSDGNSGNNYAITYVDNTSGEIMAAALTVTAQTDTRGYDGTTNSSAGPVVTGTVYDQVTTAATQSFDDRNAGTGKTLTASGLVIADGNSGNNYTITYVDDMTGEITQAALTVTAQADSRSYNGTNSSTVGPVVSGTIFGPDSVDTVATQSFDNKNTGTGKTLTASGLLIDDGNNGNNYAISYVDDTTGEITQAVLAITADSGQGKIYGNADPSLTYTATGLFGSDTVSGDLLRAPGENVGGYAIGQGSVDAGTNYLIDYTGANFDIATRSLTITANSGQFKLYGTVDPILTYSIGGMGLANGDSLSGQLARAAGENTGPYAITQGSLAASNNYDLSFTGNTFEITVSSPSDSLVAQFLDGREQDVRNALVKAMNPGDETEDLSYASGGSKKEPGVWVHLSSADVVGTP